MIPIDTAAPSHRIQHGYPHGIRLQTKIPCHTAICVTAKARSSQVADDATRSMVVPAVTAGILFAGITSSRIAGITDGTRLPAVCLAVLENKIAVFAPRNRRDTCARLNSD